MRGAENGEREGQGRAPLGKVLAGRCPRCGEGRLFKGLLSLETRCSHCGLDLEKADPGDGPAVFIIFILGALVVPAALLLEARAAPPLWLHLLLWPPIILGGSLLLLRPLKALMIALQFRHKASDSGLERYDD